MPDPYEELTKRAGSLSDEEKLALFQAFKNDPVSRLPGGLWKATSDEEIEKGLNRIRFARRARIAVWVGIVLAGAAMDKFGRPISSEALGFVFVAVVMAPEAVLLMLSCPRCGSKFISRVSRSFTRTCCNCGLSLDKGLRAFFW